MNSQSRLEVRSTKNATNRDLRTNNNPLPFNHDTQNVKKFICIFAEPFSDLSTFASINVYILIYS